MIGAMLVVLVEDVWKFNAKEALLCKIMNSYRILIREVFRYIIKVKQDRFVGTVLLKDQLKLFVSNSFKIKMWPHFQHRQHVNMLLPG